MKNLFDNAVQQSVISSSAMEKETSLLVHSAMNHIIIGNPMCCGAYAQNAISAIKISHPERFEGVKDYFTFDLRYTAPFATVYKGNIIKNLIMDCQSYTKYRPNETTGGIFVSWRRKEELPTGA